MATSQVKQEQETFWTDQLDGTIRIQLQLAGRPYSQGNLNLVFGEHRRPEGPGGPSPTSRVNVSESTLTTRHEVTLIFLPFSLSISMLTHTFMWQ